MEWHRKLAHLSFENLKKVSSLCDGVPSSLAKCEPQSCSVCFQAKQVREPFSSVRKRATRPLQIIHTDVCGPIEPLTPDKKRYFISFIDDYSNFCEVYLMLGKLKCLGVYENLSTKLKTFFKKRCLN